MKNKIARSIGTVIVISLIGKISGLFRDVAHNAIFGTASSAAAAFQTASLIPRVFLDFTLASAISASFIPIFNEYLEKKGRDAAFRLACNFMSVILLFALVATGLLYALSPFAVSLFAGGMNAEARELSVGLLRVMLPTLIISAAAFSVAGILQSLDEFNLPAAMSIASNVIIIGYYFLFLDRFGIYGLAAAFLLGWATQLLIQLPALRHKRFRFRPFIDFRDEGLRRIAALVVPAMIGAWVFPINMAVNNNVASGLFGGSGEGVNALNSANALYSVITGVVILSATNVIFPRLSKLTATDSSDEFGHLIRRTLSSFMYIILPMSAGLIALGRPIVSLFFERGSFNAFSTEITSKALAAYSVGMVGFGLQNVLSRGFYAEKDGKTPLITGLAAITVNAVLSVLLVKNIGISGPPLASAVSINLVGGLMLVIMRRRNKAVFDKTTAVSTAKAAAAALGMGVSVFWLHSAVQGSLGISFAAKAAELAICVIAGAAAYFAATAALGCGEARLITGRIRGRLQKR